MPGVRDGPPRTGREPCRSDDLPPRSLSLADHGTITFAPKSSGSFAEIGGVGLVSLMPADLDAVLANFADRVPGVNHAIAVAADGLLISTSPKLARDRADTAAAITSGLLSLTARSAQLLQGGSVTQTMVEMREGYLFMMAAVDGSALVAWAESSCDVGQVGFELAILASYLDAAPTRWP
jgi:predicted regulator of Ras-like GTPase activity (Roadblock/LC7/MglB family)